MNNTQITNIIVGFGSTEESYRETTKRKIKEIVEECVSGRFNTLDDISFNDELLKEIEQKVNEYAEKTRKNEKIITSKPVAERPERYSYIYIHFIGDSNNLFFGIDFFHINNRHPMSPDGIAMMSTRDCMWIKSWDFRDGILKIS